MGRLAVLGGGACLALLALALDSSVRAPRVAEPEDPVLTITMAGHAGLLLDDGRRALLVDVPYNVGAYGAEPFARDALLPRGRPVVVLTHGHADHVDLERVMTEGWEVVGPPDVAGRLPPSLVLGGDSITVGAFSVVALPTPHAGPHRAYRIRWAGRVLLVAGDTEEAGAVPAQPPLDLVFAPHWSVCGFRAPAHSVARRVAYHRSAGEAVPCADVLLPTSGDTLILARGGGVHQ